MITNESEWSDLKDKMDSVNEATNDFENVPVNFGSQIVIACFDQVRPNGGYNLTISEVNYNGSELETTIVTSGGDGITTSVITQPYHIIVLDKCENNPKVKFK